jgi:hypothetical protein
MVVRKRSGTRGLGAVAARVAIVRREADKLAPPVLEDFTAINESALNSDSAHAYVDIGRRFREHRTVEHSSAMVGPKTQARNATLLRAPGPGR